MGKETFETKIKRIAEEFERRPPQSTWEHIREGIAASESSPSRSVKLNWFIPAGLLTLLLLLALLARPFFATEAPWLDNYWDALALAKQENKPLLVYITRSCPECTTVDEALQQPQLMALVDHFVPVRMIADDRTPIDSSLYEQMFPGMPKTVMNEEPLSIRIGKDSIGLQTYGQVWNRLQYRLNPYDGYDQRQPYLVIVDAESEKRAGSLSPSFGAEAITAESIEKWLAYQFEMIRNGHLQAYNLFKGQCGQCHARNMKDNLTGPALGGVRERWSDYPEEDLYRFINESQAMIADGHPKAVEIWNQWKPTVMMDHRDLTNQDIKQLLDYIEWQYLQN